MNHGLAVRHHHHQISGTLPSYMPSPYGRQQSESGSVSSGSYNGQ